MKAGLESALCFKYSGSDYANDQMSGISSSSLSRTGGVHQAETSEIRLLESLSNMIHVSKVRV